MTQSLIVGFIVALAALYVLWRYMPQKWRNPLARINPKLAHASGCGSGCTNCDSPGTKSSSSGSSCHSAASREMQDSKPIVLHGRIGERQ
ncbi:hypothetical protein [Diaphorobacter aerolatus]|uniref:FeoB-associated Cys-rich membrane protein n=1 Tax=Diaphorobacter aerolatus TaxID=1288495 RepID=A0A7H0GQX7_9BURK|nr:hypothetical protein [Diaphorobacter aerolatus]QNP50693.1 hypothetical protein H9K75_06475 [Diaphorobacter aerolatus]